MSPEAQRLIDAMRWISQSNWAAGWLEGTEYALWNALQGKGPTWSHISAHELRELRKAFADANVWIRIKPAKMVSALASDTNGYFAYYDMYDLLSIEEWERHLMEELL